MTVVTPDFIQRILRTGSLAEAQERVRCGKAHPQNKAQWGKFSSWALVCEEVLDTEQSPEWYDDILAELTRRGFSEGLINRMRLFAWQTAGWLNFDMRVWDWVSLDEDDIRRALDWQRRDGLITPAQHAERLTYIEHPYLIPALEPT